MLSTPVHASNANSCDMDDQMVRIMKAGEMPRSVGMISEATAPKIHRRLHGVYLANATFF